MPSSRLLLAAPRSGSGKTLLTCALLEALTRRGKKIRSFKCGPDYIDPMFHEKVLGIPSRNLDLYFTGEEETRALFLKEDQYDISVIEGVMGLYDGLAGISEEASSYHLATVLRAPILLIVNARGMGRSVLAEIAGFLSMDHEKRIRGVILNQVSKPFYESIAPLVERELGIAVLGYFPLKKGLEWESRYLGLKLPEEIQGIREKVAEAAGLLEETAELDRILEIADAESGAHPLEAQRFPWLEAPKEGTAKVKVGVAMDEAFCFYYEDNFRLLQNAGAELIPFSPLRDARLPSGIQGMLLGGGYPELFAKELSVNAAFRRSVREALEAGMPSLAECGGFMYLHDEIRNADGIAWPMAGALRGTCRDTGKLVRFGYAQFRMPNGLRVKGHEFHYYDSSACGEDCEAEKPISGKSWRCGYFSENRFWSFGHLYYPSEPQFVNWFVDQCKGWKPLA